MIPCSYFILIFLVFRSIHGRIVVLSTNDTYEDRPAAFGPRYPTIEGIMVAVESLPTFIDTSDRKSIYRKRFRTQSNQTISASMENVTSTGSISAQYSPKGCKPVIAPKIPKNTTWIALVERGECSFIQKIDAMQKSGAAAVVVGDNEKNNGLITMYAAGDTSYINVPSVFIMQWSYRDLRYLTTNHWRMVDEKNFDLYLWVRIERNHDFQWPLLDIIIVTVIVPSVILIFLYSLWKFRRQRQLALEDDENGGLFTNGHQSVLSEEELLNLPVKLYDESDSSMHQYFSTCAVCLDDFKLDDEVRLLIRCGHTFHVECIDPWLKTKKRSCPVCKVEAWVSENSTVSCNSESEHTALSIEQDDTLDTNVDISRHPINIPSGARSSEESPLLSLGSGSSRPPDLGISSNFRLSVALPARISSLFSGRSEPRTNEAYISVSPSESMSSSSSISNEHFSEQAQQRSSPSAPQNSRTGRHSFQGGSMPATVVPNAHLSRSSSRTGAMTRWFGTPSSLRNSTSSINDASASNSERSDA